MHIPKEWTFENASVAKGFDHHVPLVCSANQTMLIVRFASEAVAEDISSYDFYTPPSETSSTLTPPVLVPDTLVQFLDAPPLPTDTVPNQGLLRIGVAADGQNWNGSAVYRSDDGGDCFRP